MKLADQLLATLNEGLSLSKRVKLIKQEVELKEVTTGQLLCHLSSLESILEKYPSSKSRIKPIIQNITTKLNKKPS